MKLSGSTKQGGKTNPGESRNHYLFQNKVLGKTLKGEEYARVQREGFSEVG